MTVDTWFAVLPDGDVAQPAVQGLRPRAAHVIEHASGRPWLMGDWPDGRVTVAEAGTARLAVIGRCPVTAEELAVGLGRVRNVEETEQAVRGLAGSFHVAASIGSRVAVRGSASGVRRIHHARVGRATVGACRTDTLAVLTEASFDEKALALRLLSAPPPYPLDSQSMWRGVETVRPHDCLVIEPDGHAHTRRWWTVPEPELPAAEGTHAVRQALEAAVGSCTAAGGTISSDLSGGMDSTSLCFLAARDGTARLVTMRWASHDASNDDTAWAERATAELPAADHVVSDVDRAPLWYGDLADVTDTGGEPGLWARDAARIAALAQWMTDRGSRLHMTGGAADELFTAMPQHLHDYVRSHPLAALARIRRQRAFLQGPLWPVLRGLADRSSFSQWLAAWADGLTGPVPSLAEAARALPLSWGTEQRMPVWATPDAVRTARDALREAATAGTEPLARQRGQHMALACVRAGALGTAQLDRLTSAKGLEYAAPFLDDCVIEAALSVRVAERNAPGRYKPVLVDALRPIVTATVLDRSTKGEYSTDFHHAVRRNRATLLDLCDTSALARAGLIDTTAFRAELLAVHPSPHGLADALDATLGCEIWLRGHATGCRRNATSCR
ncbi:asparagine synthase [Streptomyces cinnamoneus]|uniref:asparagine synthase (glutamine-hydrolyzing) n=1 Tax=Streptomyces cinnamoneus TaxID=53446 RepID=A0A918TRE5_STRCJ|nr:asparagine synthase [Streptomyces cinnamoneus]GHC59906.1 asparagine synthase [Streptomyces cinnamoneus]